MTDPPSFLVNLVMQVPIVAAFIWFVLQQQKTQHASNREHHDLWQSWLTTREEASFTAFKTWQLRLEERDVLDREGRKELLATLIRLDKQLEQNTNMLLLLYAKVNGDPQLAADVMNPNKSPAEVKQK